MTDDPVPTDPRRWEIYAPVVEGEGKGADVSGSVGAEINYGAAPDVQVTVDLPMAFSHDAGGTNWGAGDLGLSVKYRFLHDERTGLSIAAFPALTLPTASNGMGNGMVTAFLPVWVQKDAGPWSTFAGGGYTVNPAEGSRNYWRGAVAVSRQVTPRLLFGIEAEREGADSVGGESSTRLGVGAIYQLRAPFRLLAAGGPTFQDGARHAGFHGFVALGLDY